MWFRLIRKISEYRKPEQTEGVITSSSSKYVSSSTVSTESVGMESIPCSISVTAWSNNRSNGPELISLVRRCIRLYIEKHQNKTFWAKTSLSFIFIGPNSVHPEVFSYANHNGTSFKAV